MNTCLDLCLIGHLKQLRLPLAKRDLQAVEHFVNAVAVKEMHSVLVRLSFEIIGWAIKLGWNVREFPPSFLNRP